MKIGDKTRWEDVVSLREYIESKLHDRDEAIRLAAKILDVRLDQMNEFRAQINAERGEYMTRREHQIIEAKFDTQIQNLQHQVTEIQGRTKGSEVTMSKIYAAIGAFGAVVAIIMVLVERVFH